MANEIVREGYGQVEPNHLSAKRTGQIYAQLPVDDALFDATAAFSNGVENGMFAKYDYENGVVNLTGTGEWMLVYNEVKLYNEQYQNLKHFAMQPEDAVGGEVVPRLFKTNVGDIYTTNCVDISEAVGVVGTKLTPGDNGQLKVATGNEDMLWNVVAVTTMPDGQPAVKLQRVV